MQSERSELLCFLFAGEMCFKNQGKSAFYRIAEWKTLTYKKSKRFGLFNGVLCWRILNTFTEMFGILCMEIHGNLREGMC